MAWQETLDSLRPFGKHLPTVAAASAFAALWGLCRAWKSSSRHWRKRGYLRRSCSVAISATFAAMGAMIFAGLIVETLDEHPWLVVMSGAGAGVVIDVTASNGPQRILEAALMFMARVRKIWTDRPPDGSER